MNFKLIEEYLLEKPQKNKKTKHQKNLERAQKGSAIVNSQVHDPLKCPQCLAQLRGEVSDEQPAQNESFDITNEVRYAVDNIMKNKDKYPNQDSLESAIYSAIANSFSDMQGVTRDTADMIADVFEQELDRVGLSSLEEDFVYDLEPGNDYYFMHNNHLTKGKFKYKTKAWQVFEREDGEEVRINAWSNVATTPEDITGVEQVVDRMEKDTKVPNVLHLPNRFVK